MKQFSLILLSCFCIWSSIFAQSTSNTDIIIEGKIVKQESFWNADQSMILTKNTVEIYKNFKGSLQTTFNFITEGGQLEKNSIQVNTHHLAIHYGDAGIFLLQNKNGKYVVQNDGFIKYDILNKKAYSKNLRFTSIENDLYKRFNTPQILKNESLFLPPSSSRGSRTEEITSITPTTITAGTQSILTINGSGFGDVPSQNANIFFSDANSGGEFEYPLLQFGWVGLFGLSEIVEWTDTRIQVLVPTFAGTGRVVVVNENGDRFVSNEILTIPYAVEAEPMYAFDFGNQNSFDQEATKRYLSNYNGQGGYTLFVDPDFFADNRKMTALRDALNFWRCETGFNVNISANQAPIPWGFSGKTAITTFDGREFGDTTTRSYSYSRVEVCNTGTQLVPFVIEFQIFVNEAINWSYDGTPEANEVDFKTELLKSLARGLQVGHVNQTNDLMYYQLQAGVTKAATQTNLEAANLMMNYSTSADNDCGLPAMQAVPRSQCQNSVNPPLARFEADVTVACQAPLDVRFNNTSRNATSYQWTFNGGTPSSSTEQHPRVRYNTAGTYTVSLTVTNAAGTHTETKTNYITVGNGLDFNVDLGTDKNVCQGETVTLDAGIDNATYLWSTGQNTKTITVQNAGTYQVTVTRNGCVDTDEVRVSFTSGATVDAGSPKFICSGESVVLDATATGATSYHWTPSTGLSNVNDARPIASPEKTTTYYLEIGTNSTCGTVRDSVTVTVKEPLRVPSFPVEDTIYFCQNQQIFIDAYPENALNPTFLWSNGRREASLIITTSGTYWVEVNDAAFCTFRDTVTVIQVPELRVSAGEDITICRGQTVSLRATGATYYEWEGEGIISNPSLSAIQVSPRETTTYRVTGFGGFDVTECEPKMDEVTVIVIEPVTLDLGQDQRLCEETTYTIDATVRDENATYLWDDTSTNPIRTVSDNGTYFVTITSLCGTLSDTIKVEFFAPSTEPNFDFTVSGAELRTENTTQTTYPISYAWDFGDGSTSTEGSPVHQYTQSGTYTVRLTVNSQNCNASEFIEKDVNVEVVTGIEDDKRAKQVSIYPNPSMGVAMLKWEAELGRPHQLTIFNTLGQEVNTSVVSINLNECALSMPLLPKGIYVVKLSFKDYTVQKKWVVE